MCVYHRFMCFQDNQFFGNSKVLLCHKPPSHSRLQPTLPHGFSTIGRKIGATFLPAGLFIHKSRMETTSRRLDLADSSVAIILMPYFTYESWVIQVILVWMNEF